MWMIIKIYNITIKPANVDMGGGETLIQKMWIKRRLFCWTPPLVSFLFCLLPSFCLPYLPGYLFISVFLVLSDFCLSLIWQEPWGLFSLVFCVLSDSCLCRIFQDPGWLVSFPTSKVGDTQTGGGHHSY